MAARKEQKKVVLMDSWRVGQTGAWLVVRWAALTVAR